MTAHLAVAPPALTPALPSRGSYAPRRAHTVEMVDVAERRAYCCRDCGAIVRLSLQEPLPPGWQVVPAPAVRGECSRWHYLCPEHSNTPSLAVRILPAQRHEWRPRIRRAQRIRLPEGFHLLDDEVVPC